ncbi:hypothetical protein PGTUg99_003572 [Puccinia graminis f. sp. tritici]|uniref:Uncharacterized protein n=1 Tax=Puccinia graminis f. sp. tritici TaxID=56615 RepID=A0A5B0SFU4_PUCGR|nr:hypothetical protein PGTUg99_011194 [Puccinia graminis f. sp. tritici]KAA1136851.1 hypothetical protein PGTUg99_003572 [Puccinia graminis f. sp. tritici]
MEDSLDFLEDVIVLPVVAGASVVLGGVTPCGSGFCARCELAVFASSGYSFVAPGALPWLAACFPGLGSLISYDVG